jgi:hypothetical protein
MLYFSADALGEPEIPASENVSANSIEYVDD